MSKFSIIVPVYNAEQWLERCVDSIVAQTYTDWELLLVDDGSTDRSGTICDRYAASDPRIQAIHKPNGGVSSARNLGLDHAQGEWITFADADDFTYPCWLENYDVEHNAEFDLICQGFELPNPYLSLSKTNFAEFETDIKESLLQLFAQRLLGYLWVKAFKLSIIQKNSIRFNENYNLLEDEDFLLSYAIYSKKAIGVNRIGYYYFPPYCNKYAKAKSMKDLTESLYLKCLTLYNKVYNSLTVHYLNYYTDFIYSEFKNKCSHRKESLKHYRKIVSNNVIKTRLFPVTKLLIRIDSKLLFSPMWLDLITSIKK